MGSGQSNEKGEQIAPTPQAQRIPQPPRESKSTSKRKREKSDKNRDGGDGGGGNGKNFVPVVPESPVAQPVAEQQPSKPIDDHVKKHSLAPNQYSHLLNNNNNPNPNSAAGNPHHHGAGNGHPHPPVSGGGHDDLGKRATFRQVVKRAVELAKEQRERYGKFRKDEKRAAMELYEVLGLDDDVFLAPPNELQKRLSSYRFPPTNMHMLRDVDVIDEDTMEFILGAEETKLRRSEGLEVLPRERKANTDNLRRAGVSSEATRMLKMNVFKTIPKTKEQTERLTEAMKHNVLFKGLDKRDVKTLFDAFEQETFSAESPIFEQGDEGDKFYLIDHGRCQITIRDERGAELHSLFVGEGDTFGELAIMYGTPRAATVTAVLDTECWWIDRETYRGTLLNQTIKKRDTYLNFLESVPILSCMDQYEKARMADVLEIVDFTKGHVVVREGERGDAFYIVEEGEVKVEMSSRQGEVSRLGPGKFFGELALLFDRPRVATVTVHSAHARLVMLNRLNFTNYLGPLDDILRRNADQYKQYIQQAQGGA